jgi:large subunit ribosomal protein L9
MRKIKVILQKDFPSLGFIGDEIEVRGGYARNYLFKNGIAFEAARGEKGYVKHKLAAVLSKKVKLRSEAEDIVRRMEGMVPEFTLKMGDGGKTFGSISNRDVAKWLDDKGFAIDKSQIVLAEPVKKSGEHQVKIRLHAEVAATIKIRVSAEAAVVPAKSADEDAGASRRGRGRTRRARTSEEATEAGSEEISNA